MKVKISAKLNMKSSSQLAKAHGLGKGGNVQKFVDNEVIKQLEPFVPMRDGGGYLANDAFSGTDIGSGLIKQSAPYARFQYYGKVMIYEPTGSTWAPKYGKKVVTDRDLKYNGAPQRGKMWFPRMKAAKGQEILKGAQNVLKKG